MDPIPELAETPPAGTVETIEAANIRIERRNRVWYVSDLAVARAIIAAGITPLEPPTPPSVELEQVLEAMVLQGWMTGAEALSCAANGAMPASIATPLLNGLDQTQTFRINLVWRCRNWHRLDAKIWRVMVLRGVMTKSQVNAIFRAAALLD
jgi:hypothetical protein